MFTFLLRKDLAEAAELVADLHQHRDEVAVRLKVAGRHAETFLGTPAGLGVSFAAGCAVGWMLRHNPPRPEQAKELFTKALPWVAFARQFV